MQKVILYIQPDIVNSTVIEDFIRVDLMEEELISITSVIQDIKDIEKLFTDYSKTFNLPASKTNNKFFKHWYNPDIDAFNNQVFSNAKIELNHFEFKTGKIQLNEVELKNGKPLLYKVTFFGDTVAFKNAINEDQLSDLLWLDNFNHEATDNNVKAGLQTGLDFTVDSVSYSKGIIYPLISHSSSYVYDTSNGDAQGNPLNISIGAEPENITKRGVFPEDLKPAITLKIILKAIQEQYNIVFKAGKFFDSSAMTNLYMWLHREKGAMILRKSFLFNTTTSGGGSMFSCSGSDCTALTDVNYQSNINFRGFFDLPTGVFHYRPDLTVDTENTVYTVTTSVSSTTVPYTLQIIRLNNMEVFAESRRNFGNQSLSINIFTNPLLPNSPSGNRLNRVDLLMWSMQNNNEASKFAVRIICEDDFGASLSVSLNRTYVDAATVNLSGTMNTNQSTFITTKFVIISDNIPKIKIKDFLNGLFRQYNLTAYLEYNNEIIIETIDSFYAGGQTQDLTKFIKTDKQTISETIPFSEIDFEYSEPKSILAEQFALANNQKYGELNYVADVSKKNIYKIKIPFEQMLFERLNNQGAPTSIQVGTFMDTELKPSIGAPLIFYGIFQNVGSRGTVVNFITGATRPADGTLGPAGSRFTLPTFWMPSVCNTVGSSSTAPTHNLNFGSEINTFTLTDYSGNNNSLFQTYYENYITRVFNTRTRLFKMEAVLPLKVLLTLTLDDLIIIGDRTYTINKMTTKLQSGETSFELLNEPS